MDSWFSPPLFDFTADELEMVPPPPTPPPHHFEESIGNLQHHNATSSPASPASPSSPRHTSQPSESPAKLLLLLRNERRRNARLLRKNRDLENLLTTLKNKQANNQPTRTSPRRNPSSSPQKMKALARRVDELERVLTIRMKEVSTLRSQVEARDIALSIMAREGLQVSHVPQKGEQVHNIGASFTSTAVKSFVTQRQRRQQRQRDAPVPPQSTSPRSTRSSQYTARNHPPPTSPPPLEPPPPLPPSLPPPATTATTATTATAAATNHILKIKHCKVEHLVSTQHLNVLY